MTAEYDAVIVGGGHNGLVAAAYLARSGLRTLVCERREVLGGAAVSEHPFGPEYTVTSLSYVVSLLPAGLVRDLRLDRHGYHVYPQGPYFAPRADGRYLRLPADPAERHAEIAKFSARDADNYGDYEARLVRIAGILGPHADRDSAEAWFPAAGRPVRPGAAAAAPAQGGHQAGRGHHQAAHRQHRRSARPVLHQRCAARAAVGLRRDRHVGWPAIGRHRVRDAAPPHRRHRRPGRCLGLPARRDGRGHDRAGRRGALVRRRCQDRRRGRRDHHCRRPGDRRGPGIGRARERAGSHHDRASEARVPQAGRSRRPARRLRRRHQGLADQERDRQGEPGARPDAGVREPPRLRPAGARRDHRAGRQPR